MFLFNFLALVFVLPLVNFDLISLMNIVENPLSGPETRMPLLFIQAIIALGTFIITPILFRRFIDTENISNVQYKINSNATEIVIVAIFTFSIMPFSAFLMEWNQNLELPSFLSALEEWVRGTHEFVEESTKHLTNLQSPHELIIGLIVIALIPAIGEEFLFRGIAQKYLIKGFNNHHLGILASAFLFSFFHMQIFIILPRMVLGIVYGYFYYFSRNLLVPVVAHFINNSFMIIMIFLYNRDMISFNIENEESLPWSITFMSLLISLILFFYLRYKFKASENPNEGMADSI